MLKSSFFWHGEGQGNVVYVENHAMHGLPDVKLRRFLTSALQERRLATSFGPFTFGKRAHGTVCITSWLGPRTGLDEEAKKTLTPETQERTKNNIHS
jgi:hypothetical protein